MSKKSESIEIRVSHEVKSQLANLCRTRGLTMSEVVRQGIDHELAGQNPFTVSGDTFMRFPSFASIMRPVLVALPVLLLTLLYWSSTQTPVTASPQIRVYFSALDYDGDGMITQPEYARFLIEEDDFEASETCGSDSAVEEPCTAQDAARETLDRVDSDASGTVGYEEFEAFILLERAHHFIELDRNENGFVTAEEFFATELQWALDEDPEPLTAACRAVLEAEKVEGVTATCVDPQEARMVLAEFDANRDDRITLREFLEH